MSTSLFDKLVVRRFSDGTSYFARAALCEGASRPLPLFMRGPGGTRSAFRCGKDRASSLYEQICIVSHVGEESVLRPSQRAYEINGESHGQDV